MEKVNWQIKKLGEVCKTTSGGTPSRRNPDYYNGSIPWVKSGELDKGIILNTEEKITDEAIKNSSAKVFPKGTLLIALYGATIGKLAFLGIEAATNQAVCGIFENQNIVSKYIYYFLLFNKPKLIQQGVGGAQPNISQTILKDLDLPVPPLKTQHAIVTKLEELFSELDKGIAELKTAQQQLKTYRQSVLKWAFEGKKRILFENITESSQNGLSKRSGLEGEEFNVLRLADIKNNSIVIDSPRKIKMTSSEILKYKLNEKDLVCIRVNGSKDLVGQIVYISKNDSNNKWAFCDHFIRFTLKGNFDSKFIYHYFQSMEVRKFIHDNMVTSAGQNTVSQVTIKNVLVPYCNLEEQYQIVQEIESRLSVADKLEADIEHSLQQAEALRQSILKKAFSGELI